MYKNRKPRSQVYLSNTRNTEIRVLHQKRPETSKKSSGSTSLKNLFLFINDTFLFYDYQGNRIKHLDKTGTNKYVSVLDSTTGPRRQVKYRHPIPSYSRYTQTRRTGDHSRDPCSQSRDEEMWRSIQTAVNHDFSFKLLTPFDIAQEQEKRSYP